MARQSDNSGIFGFGNNALKHLQKHGVDGLVFTVGIVVGCGALALKADPTAVVIIYVFGISAFLFGKERDAARLERAAERELERLRLGSLTPTQERIKNRLANQVPLVPAQAQAATSSESGEVNV